MLKGLYYYHSEVYEIKGHGWSYPVREIWHSTTCEHQAIPWYGPTFRIMREKPKPGDILYLLGFEHARSTKTPIKIKGCEMGNGEMIFAFLLEEKIEIPKYSHLSFEGPGCQPEIDEHDWLNECCKICGTMA